MDADKLNEAAEKELANTFSADVLEYAVAKNVFKRGAQWLITQPLSDRLTDEEKEKIKAIYKREADSMELETHRIKTAENEIAKVCHESNFWQAKLKADMLEGIFGIEMFNQPTEV